MTKQGHRHGFNLKIVQHQVWVTNEDHYGDMEKHVAHLA
ncbi:hypothetical protein SLEP1_g10322 [Rubroshorea leprosula]|uniref:Uncharacterized protein n=1 Tax=Rubroshorea leprosula TaxID=152421 RepID=A0AAV5IH74_9ROSI|nr:hypothetical protein SLEP1_g10322 [Rubroshorea leprosula]